MAEAFTGILVAETAPLERELELAWGIIANAGGGDWTKEPPQWREAAAKWRDRYHALVMPNDPSSATRPTRACDCNLDAMAGFAAAYG